MKKLSLYILQITKHPETRGKIETTILPPVVCVIFFIILNHSMWIYARFELIFDWTIDYKLVALPIELRELAKFFSPKS